MRQVGPPALAVYVGVSAMGQPLVTSAPAPSGSPAKAVGGRGPDGHAIMREVRRVTEAQRPLREGPGSGLADTVVALMPVWPWT